MKPRFTVAPGPHSFPGHIQLAIEASDCTMRECEIVSCIVGNQWTPSLDYQLKRGAEPFLQGYQEPSPGKADGWILVEFWSDDRDAIDRFVEHVNRRIAEDSES